MDLGSAFENIRPPIQHLLPNGTAVVSTLGQRLPFLPVRILP